MPILEADILIKLSTKLGSAGNSLAQADPNLSLGKYISTTQAAQTLDDLFDAIEGAEDEAEESEYRCIFVHNNHATLEFLGAEVWISSQQVGGADISIGLDPTGITAIGSAAAQAVSIADEDTAPAGVSFSTPTEDFALQIGDIGPGECAAIWIRRTANNTGSDDEDGAVLRIEGDTEA